MPDNDNSKNVTDFFSALIDATLETGELLVKVAENTVKTTVKVGKEAIDEIVENKDGIKKQGIEILDNGAAFLTSSLSSSSESVAGFCNDFIYSSSDIDELKQKIENQGKQYRTICNKYTGLDTLMMGGETLVHLLESGEVPQEILDAYSAAYPDLSETVSFEDKVLELDSDEIQGFIAGVKGKLFEMKYVDYLNEGQLPEGYTANLAESATQAGWDIAITDSNGETVELLQAKATDSVAYVREAIEKNPNIDVVTTEEVFSHLVLSGASDNIVDGGISNNRLGDELENATSNSDITMEFSPPIFSLALIAFTSYTEKNLSLYEQSQIAGERSGKTYLSYLIGGGVAVLTNTWWLGLLGAVASRYSSDNGLRKAMTLQQMEAVFVKNKGIIAKLKE